MEFVEFKRILQKNFEKRTSGINHLFTMDVDPDELWNVYLDSFPSGSNEILRVRREFDCSACRRFVKQFGNVVILKDGKLETIWNFKVGDPTYQTVIDALTDYIRRHAFQGVYVTKEGKIGTDKNLEQDKDSKVHEWHHLYIELPDRFVYSGRDTLDTVRGNYRAIRDVFSRSLTELSLDSVDVVLELINSNTLYKGEEWKGVLQQFRQYKLAFDAAKNKDLFTWEKSVEAGPVIGKIRNHSIGTLLIDITADMDLDEAVRRYEKVVAPTNYKRPKAIFTKQMLEDARKTIEELGYMASLSRRFATLDDITVNNILFSNRDAAKRITGSNDIFDALESTIAINSKKFSKIEEISISTFIQDVLPTSREIEVLFENRLASNMVSLIAPAKSDAKTMFKWDNGFSWAYTGNITDSMMKENVKMAGGNVDGVLRFSIQWNDGSAHDKNDLDAHCIEPSGDHIDFRLKTGHKSSGSLDVDIIQPRKGIPAVENIIYTDESRMPKGVYQFFVNQFANRGGKDGFTAEIEFSGQIHSFSYPRELRQRENVAVANVTFDGTNFTIDEKIPSQMSVREIWGLKTNQFVPVSVIMYSPNYWNEQDGIGHRHVFFMLKDCINGEGVSGFYNEYLKHDLEKHKHVFEALSSKSGVVNVDNQLSGIGCSTTKRASVIVKVKGATERMMKINF